MNGIAIALHAMRVKTSRTILQAEQPMSSTGRTAMRSWSQVLNIAYAGERFRGGFFPNGVTGALNSVTAL